ncbi:MAG: DUF4292 domain-containing protein [Endomicrobia bacterium]|nr:DUF4292 domain-containing protein [Endomicrobiia bacterium]
MFLLVLFNFILFKENFWIITKFEKYPSNDYLIEGKIFFYSPDLCYIKITSPILQQCIFKDDVLTIYYPEKNFAFKFLADRNSSIAENFSFKAISYRHVESFLIKKCFKKQKVKDKIKELVYKDSKVQSVYISKISDTIINSLKLKDKKGLVLFEVFYCDYKLINGNYFPQKISLFFYDVKKKSYIKEEIFYKDIKISPSNPQGISDFNIPEIANFKEVNLKK